MITETVYNHETEEHEDISWEKENEEEYFVCGSNYDIHHIVDTQHGLLVRFLGDNFSQLFPHRKIGGKKGVALLAYVDEFFC